MVSGTGFLVVELGGGTAAVYGPETNRITIDRAGLLTVPFSELNFGASGRIDNFTGLLFTFEAESENFSMTLDEIRAVPEPSAFVLTMFSVSILLRRRRLI